MRLRKKTFSHFDIENFDDESAFELFPSPKKWIFVHHAPSSSNASSNNEARADMKCETIGQERDKSMDGRRFYHSILEILYLRRQPGLSKHYLMAIQGQTV
jgi:hypothetical protein